MSVTAFSDTPASASARLLLTPYLAPVYALCYRLLQHPDQAEDATQETFLAAVKLWSTFIPPPQMGGKDPRLQWLLAIAARRALELRRKTTRQPQPLETSMEPQHEQTPSDAAERAEAIAHLEQALQDLPDDQRELVILHHVAGLSQAEIAASLAIPPRTVSHRITDGVAQLRRRLTREGFARIATGTIGFALMPAPSLPPGLAASLFSHPEILTWSSSASATTTAATASTATAGTAGMGNAAPGVSMSTTATKGTVLMSSKLTLAATAAAAGALAVAYFLLPPHPANAPAAAAPSVAAQPTPTEKGASTNSMPIQTQAAPGIATADASPVTAPANAAASAQPATSAPTNLDAEAAFAAQLTDAERQVRQALAVKTARSYPAAGNGNATTLTTLQLNTTVGSFRIYHDEMQRITVDSIEPVPAVTALAPFEYNSFKVMSAAAAEVSSSLLAGQTRSTLVTSSGNPQIIAMDRPQDPVIHHPQALQMRLDELFPAARPACYTSQALFERVGLAIPEPPELTALITATQAADAEFLKTAEAFVASADKAGPGVDLELAHRQASMLWPAAWKLQEMQKLLAAQIEQYLKDQQSEPNAWSTFAVTRQEELGLFSRAMMAFATRSTIGSQATDETGATHIQVVIPATAQDLTTVTGVNQPDIQMTIGADMRDGRPKMTTNAPEAAMRVTRPPLPHESFNHTKAGEVYSLEMHGETLGHLCTVISANHTANCALSVDVRLAGTRVEGKLAAASIPALLRKLADLAQVDLQDQGKGRWVLTPRIAPDATPPAGTGEGF